MAEQNYTNHRRLVPAYHIILWGALFTGLIVSIINVVRHPPHAGGFISSVLIVVLFLCALLTAWHARSFPLKAQDRAIRAEESLRCFILTGKAIDNRLTINQVIALRFAPDDEFAELAARAVTENLSADDIKKAIKNWRADHHRA